MQCARALKIHIIRVTFSSPESQRFGQNVCAHAQIRKLWHEDCLNNFSEEKWLFLFSFFSYLLMVGF